MINGNSSQIIYILRSFRINFNPKYVRSLIFYRDVAVINTNVRCDAGMSTTHPNDVSCYIITYFMHFMSHDVYILPKENHPIPLAEIESTFQLT